MDELVTRAKQDAHSLLHYFAACFWRRCEGSRLHYSSVTSKNESSSAALALSPALTEASVFLFITPDVSQCVEEAIGVVVYLFAAGIKLLLPARLVSARKLIGSTLLEVLHRTTRIHSCCF